MISQSSNLSKKALILMQKQVVHITFTSIILTYTQLACFDYSEWRQICLPRSPGYYFIPKQGRVFANLTPAYKSLGDGLLSLQGHDDRIPIYFCPLDFLSGTCLCSLCTCLCSLCTKHPPRWYPPVGNSALWPAD